MNPALLKIHGAIVLFSLAIYLVRGVLMVFGSPSYNNRSMIAGASISMLLIFITGVTMIVTLGLEYFGAFALTKVIGLVLYVVVGIAALRPGQSKMLSTILWIVGLAIFAYTMLIGRKVMLPLF